MNNNITSFIKFTKTGEIGNMEGKNSEVFLAKDSQLGCELVIKRVKKEQFKPEEFFQRQR